MNESPKGIFDRHPEIKSYEVTLLEYWHESDSGKSKLTLIKDQNAPADFKPFRAGREFVPYDVINFVCMTAKAKEKERDFRKPRTYMYSGADEGYVTVSMSCKIEYKEEKNIDQKLVE